MPSLGSDKAQATLHTILSPPPLWPPLHGAHPKEAQHGLAIVWTPRASHSTHRTCPQRHRASLGDTPARQPENSWGENAPHGWRSQGGSSEDRTSSRRPASLGLTLKPFAGGWQEAACQGPGLGGGCCPPRLRGPEDSHACFRTETLGMSSHTLPLPGPWRASLWVLPVLKAKAPEPGHRKYCSVPQALGPGAPCRRPQTQRGARRAN